MTAAPASTTERVELPITGMTCASCANRIERRLNKLDGVAATVNYATETATVEYDANSVAADQLVDAVAAAGYQTTLPSDELEAAPTGAAESDHPPPPPPPPRGAPPPGPGPPATPPRRCGTA
jgi:Cu+-exporting ATPase